MQGVLRDRLHYLGTGNDLCVAVDTGSGCLQDPTNSDFFFSTGVVAI